MIGAAAGVGGSLWARRTVRRSIERHLPDRVASEARARISGAAGEVRAAIGEGRVAMAEREAELRARLLQPPGAVPPGRGDVIEARSLDAGPLDPDRLDEGRPGPRRVGVVRGIGPGPATHG